MKLQAQYNRIAKELSRRLVLPVEVNGKHYTATVTRFQEATQKLLRVIVGAITGLVVLLALAFHLVIRLLVKTLWKPFYGTLGAIKGFNLATPVTRTSIDEFRELNESLQLKSKKVLGDYRSLKDFTDHASHEKTPPLALINAKPCLFLQDPEASQQQLNRIRDSYNAGEKLSRLSGSLLLLAGIEKNKFKEVQEVNIKSLVQNKITELDEWIQSKALNVDLDMVEERVRMDPQLADILMGNLLGNAIRHTDKEGSIRVVSLDHLFFISNSGWHPLNKEQIFNRLYKSEGSQETGLGLAIARQICDQYGFALDYDYKEGQHLFFINF
jgi:signal transduction histidine kinase